MARLKVRVTPRSSRSSLQYENGILTARLHAPPVNGRANEELIELISRVLAVPKSSLTVVRGVKSRCKEFEVAGIDDTELDRLLVARLAI